MKHSFFFISCLFTTFLLFSCKKDADTSNLINPADSIYLNKVLVLEGSSVIISRKFSYDQQKRVVSIIDSLYNLSAADIKNEYYYYYNGSDTLPFKMIRKETDLTQNEVYTNTSFYTFNSQGLKVKDSTIVADPLPSPPYSEITNLVHGAGTIYSLGSYNNSSNPHSFRDTAILNVQGNISSAKSWSNASGTWELGKENTISYDNKVNPFYKLNIYRSMIQSSGTLDDVINMAAANNILSYREFYPQGGFSWDVAVNYTYNSNNMPIQAVANLDGDIVSFQFTYTDL